MTRSKLQAAIFCNRHRRSGPKWAHSTDALSFCSKGSCGPNNESKLIEISFAVSQSSSKGLIASCLEMTTYQSLWSRHVIPKQIDQRNPGGNMPYFLDDGLYDFSMETYMYYTKVYFFMILILLYSETIIKLRTVI